MLSITSSKKIGPFTFGKLDWKRFGLVIDSGNKHDHYGPVKPYIEICLFGYTFNLKFLGSLNHSLGFIRMATSLTIVESTVL